MPLSGCILSPQGCAMQPMKADISGSLDAFWSEPFCPDAPEHDWLLMTSMNHATKPTESCKTQSMASPTDLSSCAWHYADGLYSKAELRKSGLKRSSGQSFVGYCQAHCPIALLVCNVSTLSQYVTVRQLQILRSCDQLCHLPQHVIYFCTGGWWWISSSRC